MRCRAVVRIRVKPICWQLGRCWLKDHRQQIFFSFFQTFLQKDLQWTKVAQLGLEGIKRKTNKNTTINQILPFVIPNLGPAARNGDGETTTNDRQRETKRRLRKEDNLAKLTFGRRQLLFLFLCHCKKCKQHRSFFGSINRHPAMYGSMATFFSALDPGRPGFSKIQGDPFIGPSSLKLGPKIKN